MDTFFFYHNQSWWNNNKINRIRMVMSRMLQSQFLPLRECNQSNSEYIQYLMAFQTSLSGSYFWVNWNSHIASSTFVHFAPTAQRTKRVRGEKRSSMDKEYLYVAPLKSHTMGPVWTKGKHVWVALPFFPESFSFPYSLVLDGNCPSRYDDTTS